MAGERFARFFRNSLVQKSSRRGDSQDANPTENKSGADIRLGSSFSYSAGHPFFEYLVVVSLKKDTKGSYEPKITYQFPKRENLLRGQREEEERLLQAIPLFCFPDGNEWAPVMEYKSETFSFVLTNIDGSRKIGYCRRLLFSAANYFGCHAPHEKHRTHLFGDMARPQWVPGQRKGRQDPHLIQIEDSSTFITVRCSCWVVSKPS